MSYFRMFATKNVPTFKDQSRDVLKIEENPFLYVDIYKNQFQQKVWSEKLKIPQDFVQKYFEVIKPLRDVSQSTAVSFEPSKFDATTPRKVVIEYMRSLQNDLQETYQKYGKADISQLQNILKGERLPASKVKDMPKFSGFQEAKLTDSEKLSIEREVDVVKTKLSVDEEALMNKILTDLGKVQEYPLHRDETYKTHRVDKKDKEVLEYVYADRSLRDPEFVSTADIAMYEDIKYKGLQAQHLENSPEAIKAIKENIQATNLLNNTLKEKILIKRGLLKQKLQMLDEIHKVYQIEKKSGKKTVSSVSGFDFLDHYQQNAIQNAADGARSYNGQDENLHKMETVILKLQAGQVDQQLVKDFLRLENKLDKKFRNDPSYFTMKMKFGIATSNDAYALQNFEQALTTAEEVSYAQNGKTMSYVPVDIKMVKDTFELFVRRDNFKGLGVLINYAEQCKLRITSLDLNLFKPSIEYYLNNNFKLSNLMVFMKYYTYMHECLFKEFNLTPEKVRSLEAHELVEYSHFLFPYNNLVDMKDLFSYIIKSVGSNRILDKHTKRDMMDRVVEYFTSYTVPFMDMSHVVNNFIRENDVAKYCANKFDEPNSFESVISIANSYGDRTLYHEFIMEELKKYQHAHKGRLPISYTKERAEQLLSTASSNSTKEIIYKVLTAHKAVVTQSPYHATEAILQEVSDGSPDFYSQKVSSLFTTKSDKNSELHCLCMIKALLKEGDTAGALRALENSEKDMRANQQALKYFYTKVYDQCFTSQPETDRVVDFFPDLMIERERRISEEISQAAKVSEHSKNKVMQKYKNKDQLKEYPVSYSDFKKKHFSMMKTMKNQTQQMMLMRMIKSAVSNNEYSKIDTLFKYLLINKEEEQLRNSIREKI